MGRTLCILFLGGLAMLLAGCGGSDGGGVSDPDKIFTIAGTVSLSGGGVVSGATMTLSGGSSPAVVTTDSDGNFSFTGLANGNYVLTPSKTTYTFTPENTALKVQGVNLVNVDFAATTTLLQGLIAYYPFSGNANDTSGNGHDGTVNGATLIADRFGSPDGAYNFNGSTDYIAVPNSNSLNLGASYTLSAWIFQRSASAVYGYRILDKQTAGACDGWNFDTYDGSTGRRLRMDVACPWTISNTAYSLNQWHHVLVAVSSGAVTFYLDGVADGSASVVSTPSNSLDLYIGACHPNFSSYSFDGIMDDIRIYDRALSSIEIQALSGH